MENQNRLSTNSTNERIIDVNCLGMYDTPSGLIKVLAVTIKIGRTPTIAP